MKTTDKFARLGAALAAAACIALTAVPASARTAYVQDGAGLLDQSTIGALNSEIGAFNSQTGKEVVVVTVPSLDGQTLRAAAQKAFEDQQVNGVLIFLSKAERQDLVVGDSASSAFFPPGEFGHIHDAMRAYFREGDFDGGVNAGVGLVIDQYRSHERSGGVQTQSQQQTQSLPVATNQRNVARTGGSSLGHLFWLIIILVAGFMIIRAIFRMFSGPRMYPPQGGPMGPGGPMAGPGYGAGYGAGYGGGYGGGGGGSFFSGLLGGLGGAFLGNELFGNRGGGNVIGGPADAAGGSWGGAPASPDASGWQADPGQADMGNAGGGDWGSGGGFDAGGGGGFDGGGGGGFDGGGGGGDSGGGW